MDNRRATETAEPPWWRLVLAFVAAPSAPVLLFALPLIPSFGADGFAVVLFVLFAYGALLAYGSTLLIGVPAYLLLRRRIELWAGNALLAGALVASGGAILILGGLWLTKGAQGPGPLQDLPGLVALLAVTALPGAFGGWVFWRVMSWGRRGRGL